MRVAVPEGRPFDMAPDDVANVDSITTSELLDAIEIPLQAAEDTMASDDVAAWQARWTLAPVDRLVPC